MIISLIGCAKPQNIVPQVIASKLECELAGGSYFEITGMPIEISGKIISLENLIPGITTEWSGIKRSGCIVEVNKR